MIEERVAKFQSRGKKNKDLKWETKGRTGHQYFEESTHTARGIGRGQVEKEQLNLLLSCIYEELEI